MYDAGKIIPGLVVFAGLLTFPIWYTAGRGQGGVEPKLKLPAGETRCVESKEFMKSEHMALLDDWRNAVVREGDRVYTATDGKRYEMSLTNTCMRCHADKAEFCDRCHNYEAVAEPYCWDCHVVPQKGTQTASVAPDGVVPQPHDVAPKAKAKADMAAPEPQAKAESELLEKGNE